MVRSRENVGRTWPGWRPTSSGSRAHGPDGEAHRLARVRAAQVVMHTVWLVRARRKRRGTPSGSCAHGPGGEARHRARHRSIPAREVTGRAVHHVVFFERSRSR